MVISEAFMETEAVKIMSGCKPCHHYHHWQKSLFLTIAFLKKFCQIYLQIDHSVSISLDFVTVFLSTKVITLASSAQYEGPSLCICLPMTG
jgi:hypothetical protein